jgi:acetyltransferase-like isoleucine patch superfamily enzyme
MDVNNLMYALDNDSNEGIMNLTTQKIMEMNLTILKELHLEKSITLNYLKKLKGYKYIDEINELKYGSFIKWIPIIDPNYLPLHFCGIICDIKITDNCVFIVAKNFMHRHYSFKMDECLIFQKLTSQELVILSALDHLEKEDLEEEDEED